MTSSCRLAVSDRVTQEARQRSACLGVLACSCACSGSPAISWIAAHRWLTNAKREHAMDGGRSQLPRPWYNTRFFSKLSPLLQGCPEHLGRDLAPSGWTPSPCRLARCQGLPLTFRLAECSWLSGHRWLAIYSRVSSGCRHASPLWGVRAMKARPFMDGSSWLMARPSIPGVLRQVARHAIWGGPWLMARREVQGVALRWARLSSEGVSG